MINNRKLLGAAILCVVLFGSSAAHANAIVPLIITGWFCMFLILVPIIIIETVVLMSIGASFHLCLIAVTKANLASTIVGIPLSILFDGVLHKTTSIYDMSPSLEQIRNEPSQWWIPVWFVALLIPFFFLSWWIEVSIISGSFQGYPAEDMVMSAVRNGNIVTYGLIAIIIGGQMCWDIVFNEEKHIEWEQARQMQRVIVAQHKALPELSSAELANKFAKKGMAELRRAEDRIEHNIEICKVFDPKFAHDQSNATADEPPDISNETGSMVA